MQGVRVQVSTLNSQLATKFSQLSLRLNLNNWTIELTLEKCEDFRKSNPKILRSQPATKSTLQNKTELTFENFHQASVWYHVAWSYESGLSGEGGRGGGWG